MLRLFVILALVLPASALAVFPDAANAHSPANGAFDDTWARTDKPVADGLVNRTWMWGPTAHSSARTEPYLGAPGGERIVQYFDKSRMEINDPEAAPDSLGEPVDPWFVTNGLLALELITGRMQLGDDEWEQRQPSTAQVAGDEHPDSPTYAMLQPLLDEPPVPVGEPILQRLHSDGSVTVDNSMAVHVVTAAHYDSGRDHSVASVFWQFMHQEGVIYERDGIGAEGEIREGLLFENPFFATGLPITEAYWVNVPVAGEFQDVLIQCFERRCLTYTPGNPQGWQVEAGNIGQHFYSWRHGDAPFPGGSGSEADPYHVMSVDDLQAIEGYLDAHFIQVADINASVTATWNDGAGFDPLGHYFPGHHGPQFFTSVPFLGSYDGSGYSISGLSIDRANESNVGIFGYLSGQIHDMSLENVSVTGETDVGGLAGIAIGSEISSATVTGQISGAEIVGGLVGVNGGTISGSSSGASVIAEPAAGGLVGLNYGGSVRESQATGEVAGDDSVGGLVGSGSDGTIAQSWSSASVSGQNNVGGLLGHAGGHGGTAIEDSYATGTVSGQANVGGLVGIVDILSEVRRSFATGSVSGNQNVGGVAGVVSDAAEFNGQPIVEAGYWDTQTTGQSAGVGDGDATGTHGVSTVQMIGGQASSTMSGLDFDQVWQTTPDSYPSLRWEGN